MQHLRLNFALFSGKPARGAGRDDIVERINREYGARMIPDGEILSLLDSVGMDARAIPGEPGVLYLAVKRP